ncbi:MAG: hypothetical protein ACYTHJ_03065 [Planctomycetota bacterium]|jgi:hypothetical protein
MKQVRQFAIAVRMLVLALAAAMALNGGCENASTPSKEIPSPIGARSISSHYAIVDFAEPVFGTAAADSESYVIVGSDNQSLEVMALDISDDGTQVTLATEEQDDVSYELTIAGVSLGENLVGLPTGSVGFLGTSMREPFLESAVSLSSSEILLTFSNQMDQDTAENIDYYEIADPDGNTDIDIRIIGATLQPELTTVILDTTPQQNIEYLIRVTNVQRRFSCDDEGRIFLNDATQGTTCAGNFRPTDPEGVLSSFVLTARTQVNRNTPLDPDATGVGGSVGLEANGAGVRRALCNGGTTGIDGGNGSDPDEELIFTADRAERAENVVLGVRELEFTTDIPVLFVSSSDSDGFDYTFDAAQIQAAFSTGVEAGDIVFANLAFPDDLMIDAIKLRETNGEIWVHSICGLAINRRLIDPTRNTANFFGIPAPDDSGPFVVSARSISDTEVIVSFNEPLNSDAPDPLHFSISPDLVVTNAVLTKYDTQIILTTTPQRVDVIYTVTVSDVFDKAGNIIGSPNSATFSYVGGPASLGADALPRVVGAASTGNTGVLVTFSKPMGPSAENAGNYVIAQTTVNPEAGALAVLSATFLSSQKNAVQLTTSAQNEVSYLLRAVNVRDQFGNQLAPPQLLVDPATAEFPGTPFGCAGQVCDGGFNAGNPCDANQADPDADCKDGVNDGTCLSPPCGLPDLDGDGLADHVEIRGYVVAVELTNGESIEREVTSDMRNHDTDGDGLTDAEERRIGSDPRSADTDADQLTDWEEYNYVYSDQNDQDTDDDGIDDLLEVDFFKTNALLADSDGDGFEDGDELYAMNRDPRIADLPQPGLSIQSVDLHLEEQFSYVDEEGVVRTEDSSTSSTLSLSRSQTVSSSIETTLGIEIGGNFGVEIASGIPPEVTTSVGIEAGLNFGLAFQSSRESTEESTNAFEQSMSKGLEISGSTSFSRDVVGGRVDALVTIDNLSDVAFSLSNLEITVSAPDPVNRASFVPIATLIPNSTLVTGEPAVYNLGVLGSSRGPIMFSSRDVFGSMVEDLMRDPRGLLFEFANFDLTDEFDRNFAYASQMARDRTVGLVIDSGDGVPERYLVAYAPVRFEQDSCDPQTDPGCDIVGGFAGFSNSGIPPFGGLGAPPGLPLEYILENVLQKRRSAPVVTAVWMPPPDVQIEISDTYLCVGGFNDGAECDPDQVDPDQDCEDGMNNGVCSNAVPADGILAGGDGVSDTIAQGDDVQLIPYGIDGLPQDAVVINAGENGVLETTVRDGDVEAVITGYATTKTCGPDTGHWIRPGSNLRVDTVRDPFSDDEQLVPFGTTDDVEYATNIIGPGPNGFIDTAPAGDDVFVGPGIPCDDNSDCVPCDDNPDCVPGVCDGQEVLYRFDRRARGQFGRVWAVLVPNDSLIGLDFRKVVLHPGQVLNLGFVQDLDRDALISNVEFLFGSSDTKQDTDGDGLDDFSEVRVGWEVGVEGEGLRTVFPDPRLPDSDRDGLGDREEQDFRRIQCECVGGPDNGSACTRDIEAGAEPENEACRGQMYCDGGFNDQGPCDPNGADPDEDCKNGVDDGECIVAGQTAVFCMNIADLPHTACSTVLADNRLDPRRRDTDEDLVSDADEVLGWLTQAAVIDPYNVIVAGSDRDADTRACPLNVCMGGRNDGQPCRYQRDCPPERRCDSGINHNEPCDNDIDCKGPTPATSGLCNELDSIESPHVCNRTGCDDVQVVPVGTLGLDQQAVVVAPGPNQVLETTADPGDLPVPSGNLLAETQGLSDDQQIALVDPERPLEPTPLGRIIIRPGVDGQVDSLPDGDDVVARGQYLQITNPLTSDTDRDQISEGLERILGSDPRDPTDGGFLNDKDGDGLTDGQEEIVGWTVIANDGTGYDVHSNPNAPDSDLDGLPDYAEYIRRTDPNNADTDNDGLSDLDEISQSQLDYFANFNDLFPRYVLDGDASAVYGTDPLNCDTDGDYLTDDFELLVGWHVTAPSDNGTVVYPVVSDPTSADTDGDGLDDGAEYKHTLGGELVPPTDPTNYDSDGDGRVDGVECANQTPVLADCTNPTTEALGSCTGNPLRGDKLVTIRYTQLTVDRGNEWGSGTVDMSWRFQAMKSTENYPGEWYGVQTDRSTCVAIGNDAWCYGGGYCSVPEGTDFVFQGPHCSYSQLECDPDNNGCPTVGNCSHSGSACDDNADCPTHYWCIGIFNICFFRFAETCEGYEQDNCLTGNEVTFSLQPGEGILLNGEANQYNECRGAVCQGGPLQGQPCDPFDAAATCCPGVCAAPPDPTCPRCCTDSSTESCTVCTSDTDCTSPATCGPNVACEPPPECSSDSDCPRYCTDSSTECTGDTDCTSPATCGPNVACQAACTGINCEAPFPANHVIYAKSLSYETLQYGYSLEVARLTDSNDAQEFSVTLLVEIVVE